MAKCNFQQPLLQSVSYDPSEIIVISWFGAQETFIIIITVGIITNIFVETMIHFFQDK